MDLNISTFMRYKLPDAKLTEAVAEFLNQQPVDLPYYQRCIRMALVDYSSNPEDYSYFAILDQVANGIATAYALRNKDDFVQRLFIYRYDEDGVEAIPPIVYPPRHLILRLVLALLQRDEHTIVRLVHKATPQVELRPQAGLEAFQWQAIVLLLQAKRNAYEAALSNLDNLLLSDAFIPRDRAFAGAWSGIAHAVLSGDQERLASAIITRNEICTQYIAKQLKRWLRSANTELFALDFFDHATTALLLAANRSIPYFSLAQLENSYADIHWLLSAMRSKPR
ncbi:hypothetical protein [Undibacterium griseum]|uniref:Uncharacterized protein n=1 Tax=Undibacterium griseum TaxID=2762295 RepID=A0ABR6YM31_9BURK|nr:hypothetical protein [Undibacterium griseum]MBC3884952.1 hypothetical protein [Undibacterium griseum]